MARTAAHRKYQLTINNPEKNGFSHDVIKNIIGTFASCVYWCMSDEQGLEEHTPHTHIYLAFKNAVEFKSIQTRFYGAHIEAANGSHSENRDYVAKSGKWLNDDKHGTSIDGTFEESGELPPERSAREAQSEAVYAMIKDGASNADILEAFPTAMNKLEHIERTRQTLLEEENKNKFRQLSVYYIWGAPGVGKTRSVMEKYGYANVYRVTNYKNPFDQYKGQRVMLFDEFRSSLPITEMLNYLDGYPFMLPCRYSDKAACYDTVYIVTNIPMEEQYPNVQFESPNTWRAWLRRINHIYELRSDDDLPAEWMNEEA